MSQLLKECEQRLRGGVPLRLDQIMGLAQEGIDASVVEQTIQAELDGEEVIVEWDELAEDDALNYSLDDEGADDWEVQALRL